jgi:succinyl-CoA synthetase beta subunit
MKVHEYQARQLLRDAGVAVPPGEMVESVEAARSEAKRIFDGGAGLAVVKAQVHAGGRGKAGFVKLVKSPDDAVDAAEFMLSNRMKSPQTPPEGLEVGRLLVAEAVDSAKEFDLAILVDRQRRTNTLIASAEGGVEIEKTAEERPEAILTMPTDPRLGLQAHQAREIAFRLGFEGKAVGQAIDLMLRLDRLFRASDASLAEINPLVLTPPSDGFPDGRVMAVDAKFSFDDNALFRQKAIAALFDPAEENPLEMKARDFGLNYIALEGDIGCLVNGAGLAMATMDIIKLHGGEPANFLDVGGSATEEAVAEAFRIILADDKVKGVLVNIFGGIMQCDVIARAIVSAAKSVGFTVPLTVRLEGTNVEEARRILAEARAEIPTMHPAGDLADAARNICEAVAAGRSA